MKSPVHIAEGAADRERAEKSIMRKGMKKTAGTVIHVIFWLLLAAGWEASALPAEKAWQQGMKTKAFSENVDRVFLVNRGWVEGRLISIGDQEVQFAEAGSEHTFSRTEVSLVELSDWLDPRKRKAANELKLRIEFDGTAENADFYFSKGTIIKQVDEGPTFTKGKDADDKAGTQRTHIWFDKGAKDRSATSMYIDVTLLPGESEFYTGCNRACRRGVCRYNNFCCYEFFLK